MKTVIPPVLGDNISVDMVPHPGGSLNTTPDILAPRIVPAKPTLSLDDDTPLEGGACNLGGDCEVCQ